MWLNRSFSACPFNIFQSFFIAIQLTSAVTGAKQTLKGLCVHEQLHNNPSLCPVVVTEKVNTVA